MYGEAGADALTGSSVADILDGGADVDSMVGGGGNDTYYVDQALDSTIEGVNAGLDSVYSTITHALRVNVEYLYLQGAGNINGSGNALDNQIYGNNGSNVLNGLAGADTMTGGNGNDTYWVDNAGDVVSESGTGIDTVQSYINNYVLGSNVEKLYLRPGALNGTGNSINNFVYGNAGNNVLDGAGGVDRLLGYEGNDTYYVDSTGDLTLETIAGVAGGTDLVFSIVNHTLGTNVENLTLTGSANINATGNTLANVIVGNGGNNFIDGKQASDTLTGSLGTDNFLFSTAIGAANVDTITDFTAADDTIRLDDAIFTALSAGFLTASAFVTGAAATTTGHRIIYNSATGAVLYDADGLGGAAAIQFATVGTGLAMAESDFFVY
jgi:Ca2+-binding RTX toxin-like protein